jgi:hypothetical protein
VELLRLEPFPEERDLVLGAAAEARDGLRCEALRHGEAAPVVVIAVVGRPKGAAHLVKPQRAERALAGHVAEHPVGLGHPGHRAAVRAEPEEVARVRNGAVLATVATMVAVVAAFALVALAALVLGEQRGLDVAHPAHHLLERLLLPLEHARVPAGLVVGLFLFCFVLFCFVLFCFVLFCFGCVGMYGLGERKCKTCRDRVKQIFVVARKKAIFLGRKQVFFSHKK